MTQTVASNLIDVKIVYPSAHKPAEREFAPETLLREVKRLALDFFGLQEGTDGGNQVVFFLYVRDQKLENLDQPLSAVADGHRRVNFRLAKEVIAG
jgi:hypothetical protein